MKRLFLTASAALSSMALSLVSATGQSNVLKEARVTQVVKDVKLLPNQAAPRPATLSDTVRGNTAIRTGAESRAELTFGDLTIARLGANTIFSFDQGSRTVELSDGAILLRVPKNSGGAKIQTAAVTAAITGTTVIAEYHPKSYAKYLVLEGTMRIYLKGVLGESVLLGPGQMMILNPNARRLPEPVDFDLKRLMDTSLFIQGFRPLPSTPLVADGQQTQLVKKADGELIDTNLVIFGRGTLVTLTDPQSLDVIDLKTAAVTLPTPTPTATPSATPAPTPSKFGTPGIITSFVPYPIDNGTVISTDPSIVRNGVTDFGKIYRGPAQDGPFSAWAFGATSAFDTTSGIDTRVFPQMAVFKFADLQLVGNPTVLTANGGVPNLGLVSVGPISSAPAGNTNFTLPNSANLLIATQNGSIALSGINFSNLNQLTLYARGAGSNLTFSGGINVVGQVGLLAEGDVQANATGNVSNYVVVAGNDYLTGIGPLSVFFRIDITAQRDVNFASRQFPNPSLLVNGLLLKAGRAANLDVSVDNSIFNMVGGPGVVVNGGSVINVTGNPGVTTLNFLLSASFTAGPGGIQAPSILFQHIFPSAPVFPGGIAMTSGGDINVSGLIGGTSIQAAGQVNAAGVLNAQSVTAGSNVTARDVQVLTLNTPGALTATGAGIHPFLFAGPGAQHQFTIGSIVSPNGIDFSGDYYVSNGATSPQPGGKLSMNATTATLDGAANFSGASGAPSNSAGGSGGQLTVMTTGAIAANAPIQATTGLNAAGVAFGGTGGTVSLTSTAGPVNVNSSILVSSNDPSTGPTPEPLRRSAAGGTLTLTSGLTSGNAITLGGGAQLFSLLRGTAPGPAGQITISSAGGNITDTGANLEADRGTITIQHTTAASAGSAQITLNGGTITSETLLASSRGDLTVGTTTPVTLSAVTLSLLATNNVTWSGGTLISTASASSGNVTLQAGNDLSITGAADIERSNGGLTNGLNLTLSAGRNLQSSAGLTLLTEGSGLTSGANISLNSGAAMNFGGGTILHTGPTLGDQAGGSNISLTAGGPITVVDLSGTVQTGAGRTLTNGGNIVLGGTSYNATLRGGGLAFLVNNSAPGIIGTGGNITLNLTGGLTTGPSGALGLIVNNSNGGRIQTGGNITSSIGGNLMADQVSVQIDNRLKGFIGTGAAINFTVGGSFTTTSGANFTILNSQRGTTGGTIVSDAIINLTLGNTNIGTGLNAYVDNTEGSIGGTGGMVTLLINGNLVVTGRVNVNGALNVTDTLIAGTLSATNVNSPGILVGAGGITAFTYPNEFFPAFLQNTITTGALTSTGGINFNGPDLTPPIGPGPFNGGRLTINVPSLTFGPSAADNIQGPVTFNGGGSPNAAAGDGGFFTVNATGDVTVGSAISATTGIQSGSAAIASGIGGTVNLNSANGTVTVNSAITVSSADPGGVAPVPRRRSAQGGNINLKSDRPESAAITINNSGQLLSLLDAAAPGPGGKITILATGQMSIIRVNGPAAGAATDTIAADRGSVDIRHTGLNGAIVLNGANIRSDIVKVGALGDNGTLTIGGGTISADTVLKLYAVGSNGAVNFISNVTLSGNSMKIIAGNSVTVLNNVIVTVGPAGAGARPADVYVLDPKLANYSNLNGGNNSTNGMFIIAGTAGPSPTSGAITHLGVAPPAFGPPGGP